MGPIFLSKRRWLTRRGAMSEADTVFLRERNPPGHHHPDINREDNDSRRLAPVLGFIPGRP